MKNIITIIFVLVCFISQSFGQSINLESTVRIDTAKSQLSIQRVEVITSKFKLKYDYKANGNDVLGVIIPKVWSNQKNTLSAMIVKTGDGKNDQFAFDSWLTRKIGKASAMIEVGRLISKGKNPQDYAGARLSLTKFTVEAYVVTGHPFNKKMSRSDFFEGWIAYHPTHAFISVGKQNKQYWGFAGTKNLSHFGHLTFINYQPETNNFWFKSQSGFGEINQKFFCQDTYIEATSFFVVPIFFYKHFSPVATKGDYSLKIEGKRTAGISNYEIMTGKKIGNDLLRAAVGINSEYKNTLRLAPSFELYKAWKTNNGELIIELRHDVLYRALSAYLVIRY